MKAKIAIATLVLAVVAQASWKTDTAIPNRPATGTLHGRPFIPKVVNLKKMGLNSASQNGKVGDRAQAYILDFAIDDEFMPSHEISVWFSTNPGEKLAGKTIVMRPYAFGTDEFRQQSYGNRTGTIVPRGVTAIFTTSPAKSESHTDKFTIRLSFGKQVGNTLTGKITLTLPDKQKSHLSGTFTSTIKSTP